MPYSRCLHVIVCICVCDCGRCQSVRKIASYNNLGTTRVTSLDNEQKEKCVHVYSVCVCYATYLRYSS